MRLFNYLLNDIKQHGTKPIVIFTPIYQSHYSVAYRKKTASAIHAPVIDFTNLRLDDSMWENTGHLNIKGRYHYTLAVAKALRLQEKHEKHSH